MEIREFNRDLESMQSHLSILKIAVAMNSCYFLAC